MELKTVKIVFNAIEANLIKTKLESEGIKSAIFDENMASLYPVYNTAIGGIKIKVRKEDYEKACQVLQQ